MSLTTTKAADAKDMNTVGEGENLATFNVADKAGEWFSSKAQYPLIDTESGTRFEAGVPTRAVRTGWVQAQIDALAMQEVEAPADAKGKAATTENPAVDETPHPKGPDGMGNALQSTVMGS